MPLRFFEKLAALWRAEWQLPKPLQRADTEERALEELRARLNHISQELAVFDRRKTPRGQ